jgi:hypothetical protein
MSGTATIDALTAEAVEAVSNLDFFTLYRMRRAALKGELARQAKAEAACREIECPHDGDCGGCSG